MGAGCRRRGLPEGGLFGASVVGLARFVGCRLAEWVGCRGPGLPEARVDCDAFLPCV